MRIIAGRLWPSFQNGDFLDTLFSKGVGRGDALEPRAHHDGVSWKGRGGDEEEMVVEKEEEKEARLGLDEAVVIVEEQTMEEQTMEEYTKRGWVGWCGRKGRSRSREAMLTPV